MKFSIAGFTYLLPPKDMSANPTLDQTKAKALADFMLPSVAQLK